MATKTGRQERRESAVGRVRRPDLSRYYHERREVVPGDFEFRLQLLRGRGVPLLELDPVVESFGWADEEAAMTGTLQLRRPDPEDASSLPIGAGHRVRCLVRWRGQWYRVWTMRVIPPETDVTQGSLSVELTDDLDALKRTLRDWTFRKTAKRRRGWLAHEVVREVCRQLGLPIGALAKGTVRINKIRLKRRSGLDAIRAAYAKENEETGRRFIVRIRDGKVEVVAYRRNQILYQFGEQIEDAMTSQEQGTDGRVVTVIEARGRIGKKKVRHTEFRRSVTRRYGYIPRQHDYGRVRSVAELRRKARRSLARSMRVKRTAELTVPGVPFVRRGDGCRWITTEPGWHGSSDETRDRSYVFVDTVRHQVNSGGDYTTSMSVTQVDPFVKDQERRDKEARERARRKRKRKVKT